MKGMPEIGGNHRSVNSSSGTEWLRMRIAMWGVNWAQIVGTMGSAVAISTFGRDAAADQGRSPDRSPQHDGHMGAGQSSTEQGQPASDREAERRAGQAMGEGSAEPGP